MNYCEDAKYFQFMIENTIEAEKLRGFTKLLLGVHENVSYSNLEAIKEDVGDKIRNVWDKFVAFINRVWAKFMDYANRIVQSERGYLEQYKDIILNKQPNDVDLEMRNYVTGIHNMTTVVILPFLQSQNDIPVDPAVVTYKQKLIPAYTDANKEWSSFCVAYFQGGEDKISTNLRQLNMTDIYNYCHDYSKIETVIKKDQDVLLKTYSSIQGEITTAKNNAQTQDAKKQADAKAAADAAEAKKQADAKAATVNTPDATPPVTPAADTAEAKKVESTIISDFIKTYFTEDDRLTIGTVSPATAANNAVTTNDTSKASANMKSMGTNSGVKGPNGEVAKAADTTHGANLDDLEKKMQNYNTTASGILTAKMTSAHVIFQDYMKIIKLHVGQQVGKDATSKVAQSGTNYNAGLTIDPGNADNVLKDVAAAEAETDPTKKSAAIQNLIGGMQVKFPNFKGGIDDIRKAAVAAKGKKTPPAAPETTETK